MRRGDAMTTSLLWGTLIVLTLIIGTWTARNIYPVQEDLSRIDIDLESLSGIASEACNSYEYERRFNPRTEAGKLTFENYSICITTEAAELCTYSVCDLNVTSTHDLGELTYVKITKEQTGMGEIYEVRVE